MDAEQLKNSRKGKKSALTREINTTIKFPEAGIADEIEQRLVKIKQKFSAFEAAHEAHHDILDDDNVMTERGI